MDSHQVAKALEVWTLQNLVNFSIAVGILACGLAIIQSYYRALSQRLTLKVSIEWWTLLVIVLVDVLLAFVVLTGYLVLNPDIMADIKIAIPFYPLASVLFALALVLRLFYGGHDATSPGFRRSVYLMLLANLFNIVGFTMVMEAPSGEYLDLHPSPFWDYVKTHLRSNAVPHGLELAQLTFYIFFPLLMLVFAWGVWAALRRTKPLTKE